MTLLTRAVELRTDHPQSSYFVGSHASSIRLNSLATRAITKIGPHADRLEKRFEPDFSETKLATEREALKN